MEKRGNELLELQESAKRRRRNIAKEAVKAKASKPSESSGSSNEWEKEDERKEPRESAEKLEEPKAAEQAEDPKDADRAEISKEAEKAKEPEKAEKAEEPTEAAKPEESKDEEKEEVDPAAEMSIADVCREKYHLSENAIEMLLEEDKQESVRAALEMLESSVDQLPQGYGNHLERLSADFDKWTTELVETIAVTEDEVETNTIKRDGTQDARELALTRKAEAELKKLEAENDIKAAEKEINDYDEQLEEIGKAREKLKAGRQAVRETLQVSERVLQMLKHLVKQLRTVGSINEAVKKNLFQDEEKRGSAQLQILRMMMQKRKSGTETPRSMPSVAVTDDEGEGRRKRVRGTDEPNEPADPPRTPSTQQPKVKPAAKVAPDIVKEKEVQKERKDRKRDLEGVHDKWLLKREWKESHGANMGFTITDDNGKKRIAVGWGNHTVQKCRLNKTGIDPSKPDMSLVNPKKPKVGEKVIDIEAEEGNKKEKSTTGASSSAKPNIFTTSDGKVRPNPRWGEERPRVEEKKMPKKGKESKDKEKKEKKGHKDKKHKKDKKNKDQGAESPEKGHEEPEGEEKMKGKAQGRLEATVDSPPPSVEKCDSDPVIQGNLKVWFKTFKTGGQDDHCCIV
ncbi:unnamed protein product [Symbiodinium necroappetens]|uniref:Uncharacterized protein n=1 Tax=Symbiodinium necroappetens TaxID=1628268 RepID=A0A812ZRC5_9DINO|nr:unnamed protein product [Symbiodinium necroappetens]